MDATNGHTNVEAPLDGHTYGEAPLNGHTNDEAPLNGHTNDEAPLNGHTKDEAPLNGHSNGHSNGHAAPAVPEVSAPANGSAHVEPEITRVRGPLGLGSASLAGKVALVTGSGRGIGREMALELGRRGANVVVNYANSAEAAEEVVAQIKNSGSDAIAVMANTSNVKDIISLFAQAVAYFGHLDIVCSNSGVVSFGHIKDVTEEEYDRVMSINTRGQFFVAREAYKHLSVGGSLIMMGSITGQAKGVPKHTLYSGSKGAIETFVRCMAIDMGDKQITVNCIAPGGIRTDMYHKVCREYIPNGSNLNDAEVDEYAATWSPLHRVGLPIDIARVVCFLASQDGEWINGKVLGIDGAACM